MSTQPLSSNAYSAGATLGSLGTGAPLQITGLASGLDTNSIVKALMAIEKQPLTRLQNQQTGLQSMNTQLTGVQAALQGLTGKAQALADPSLWASTQTVSSTNSTLVSATTVSGKGAVVGGYQVGVSQLATSAQRTFTFASPAAADTVTIDGQQISLASGASAQDFANAVNSSSTADVWATVTGTDAATGNPKVVLSNRATGAQSGAYIQVSDTSNALTEIAAAANAGQNAQYTVNGVAGSSASNTVTGAIPGVTLNLGGLTTTSGSVTINVSPPGPNTQSIQTAVQTFVSSYNSVIGQIQTQLSQKRSSSDPSQGTLYADPALSNLLTGMRQAMYAAGSGLPTGMASMLDLGVSTGASTGTATPTKTALAGDLALDATKFTSALTNNAIGVKQMLQTWSRSFSSVVKSQSGPGGPLDLRIQGDNSQLSALATRISDLNAVLADKQKALTAQFAQLESALSQSQSTMSWLTSQIASLPTP
jgi:flagellar hook-associated protein 2